MLELARSEPQSKPQMSPQEVLKHLKENGTKILVDLSSNDKIDKKPEWLDELKFARAQQAIMKFRMGVDFSSITGLLLILQIPDALEPLLSTGNSRDIPALFNRYLNTVLHVHSWYEDNIFDPSTKGYKSIRQVRSMHRHVQKLMNQKFSVNDYYGNPRVWVSQYDVAMTQFSFVGLSLAYPVKCGLISASKEEMESINYYWRVLGFMMGLEDEYNLCQFESYSDLSELYKLVLKQEFLDKFEREPCKLGLDMTKAICISLRDFTPTITFNSLAHWWSDVFMFNGYKLQPLTIKDRLLLNLNRASFLCFLRSRAFMRLSTKLHKKRFEARLLNRNKFLQRLQRDYKDSEDYKFYSGRQDYFERRDETNKKTSTDGPVGCPFGFKPNLIAIDP